MRVLITAGASGVGRGIAEVFHARGAELHICDIDDAALADTATALPGVTATNANVGAAEDLDRLMETVVKQSGGLDVLVNNAGIGGPSAPVEEVDEQAWTECLHVNLTGPFMLIKRALPIMKKQRSGCIINIITSAARTGLPNRCPYVASKVGLMGLSYNVAREAGPWNIRCNAVLPGLIDNARGRMLIQRMADETNVTFDEAKERMSAFNSMKTMISPREVGETCYFLASDAGRHISGQEIGVDGNMEWDA